MKTSKTCTVVGCLALFTALSPLALSGQNRGMANGAGGQMGDAMGMMGQSMMGQGMMGGGMMQMMGQGMGMMGTGGPSPAMILRMGNALALTDKQRSQLEAIRDEHQADATPMMSDMRSAQREAMDALAGDSPDLEAYEAALRAGANRMIEAHVAMARAAVEARSVLTAEQRDQLEGGMSMLQGMMGQDGSGMMMGPGASR